MLVKITIKVPTRAEILQRTKTIPIARDGESWSKDCLAEFADQSGVYIHCSGNKILYVGKTTRGNYGTFGERLKRECQRKASGDSRLFRLLLIQRAVQTAFIPSEEIEKRIVTKKLSREDLALLFERALIAVYKPQGNRDSI
jgi:hypothetical protein